MSAEGASATACFGSCNELASGVGVERPRKI